MSNPDHKSDKAAVNASIPTQLQPVTSRRNKQSSPWITSFLWISLALVYLGMLKAGWITQVLADYFTPSPMTIDKAHAKAMTLMIKHPLIDGHLDLPIFTRFKYSNQLDQIDLNKNKGGLDVDLRRLKAGHLGGLFWSVYVPCASDVQQSDGPDFTTATWRVRDTLEQIDITKLLVAKYSDTFELADSAAAVRRVHKRGKVASLIGIEGAHQLGNSLATLRMYRELGVRYVTLTHTCNNAFADSCGIASGPPIERLHGGLSELGRTLIKEMNRIGMIVDLSHTSDETVEQALALSEAPVILSHSNTRAIYNTSRNVPDSVLELIGKTDRGDLSGVRAGDAVLMLNAVPFFVTDSEQPATMAMLVEHIEHAARLAGKRHLGFGSDFCGMGPTGRVEGLEDVSGYPNLVAELILRGWTNDEVAGFLGGNVLRVLDKVDKVSARLKKSTQPATALYSKRPDLPWTEGLEQYGITHEALDGVM